MGPILTIIIRLAQLLFSVIVLALSVSLIKGQHIGGSPSITNFSAFLGGFGIIMAIFGFASQIFAALRDSIIIAIADIVPALAFFAGGVAMAVQLGPGVGSCSNPFFTERNDIINGGIINIGNGIVYDKEDFSGRCHEAQAVAAFELLGCVMFLTSASLMFLTGMRKRKGPVY